MADFDPYHKWLGIAPSEQPPTHYRLLGLQQFENDADVIENAADQRMAHLRSLQMGQHAAASQKLLSEIASARQLLLNKQQREAYDATLKENEDPIAARPLPPAKPFDPLAAAAEQPLPYVPPPYSAVQPVQTFTPAPGYSHGGNKGSQTGMIVMAVVAIAGSGLFLLVVLLLLTLLNGQPDVVSGPPDGVEPGSGALGGVAADSLVVDGVELDGGAFDGVAVESDVGAPAVPPALTPDDNDGAAPQPQSGVLELPLAIEAVVVDETPFALDFSPDGTTIAVGGSSGAVHFFNIARQRFEQRVQVQQGWTWDLDYAPDNSLAVSGGFSRHLYILNPQRQKVLTAKPHAGKTRVVEYSPDGSRLAVASDDRSASIHNTATGRQLFQLPHSGIAIAAGFSTDGQTLVTGGGKGHLRFWNVVTGRPSSSILNATPGCIWCLACSSKGVVAAGDKKSNLNLFQMENRRPLYKMNLQSDRVSGVDFSSNGKLLACTTEAGGLYVFDVATGKKLIHIPANGQKFTRLKFSPGDRLLAAVVASGKLLIYRVVNR